MKVNVGVFLCLLFCFVSVKKKKKKRFHNFCYFDNTTNLSTYAYFVDTKNKVSYVCPKADRQNIAVLNYWFGGELTASYFPPSTRPAGRYLPVCSSPPRPDSAGYHGDHESMETFSR